MLPDPDDGPPEEAERSRDRAVAEAVTLELGRPVLRVAGRPTAMLAAHMPEAAIDKDRDPFARKNEIGPSGHLRPAP